MSLKLCRICWNTEGWRRPSGSASAHENASYVARHGFGHEEWLFNNENVVNGERVGFIQAISKSRKHLAGTSLDVILYTRAPTRIWCKVGEIEDLRVLTNDEALEISNSMVRAGLLATMGQDLELIGLQPGLITDAAPGSIANVAFDAEAVRVLDPPAPFENQVVFGSRLQRYLAYDANLLKGIKGGVRTDSGRRAALNPKGTHRRGRKGSKSSFVDPKHDRLQNAVYELLLDVAVDVEYEADWMDLQATVAGKHTIFEVKAASSARRCIREALGQILDYAFFPRGGKAPRLVVVGDAPIASEEEHYVAYVRQKFSLDLYYAWYDWSEGTLNAFPPGRFNKSFHPTARSARGG